MERTDFYGPFMTEHKYESCVNNTEVHLKQTDTWTAVDYRSATDVQQERLQCENTNTQQHLRGGNMSPLTEEYETNLQRSLHAPQEADEFYQSSDF